MVESLIQNGANVNIAGRFGEAAIIKAAVKGMQLLIIGRWTLFNAMRSQSSINFHLLFISLSVGNEKIVQMLIRKGANVDDMDEDRSTALLHAASKGI